MELECRIEADGAVIDASTQGLCLTSTADPDRASVIPHTEAVARSLLNAYEEPTRMMEYVPGPRQGVFRVTWKPLMEVCGIQAETDLAMISVRDHRSGRLVMCSVDPYGWFELLEWAKSICALDPTPIPTGLSLAILKAISERGGGGRGVFVTTLYKDFTESSHEILTELAVLSQWGFVEAREHHSPPAYRLTRKGAEALLESDSA